MGNATLKSMAWALCRLDIETNPDRYGLKDLAEFACCHPARIDAIASTKAFMFEGQANHILFWNAKAPRD